MIDTHCHLTYEPLSGQVGEVLARAVEAGVDRMVTVGTSPDDAAKARKLAGEQPRVWFAAGLHPHYSATWPDEGAFAAAIRSLAGDPRCVAIGETGLDRHYTEPTIPVQRTAFIRQLGLARELGKPVILHSREAMGETLEVLRDCGIAPGRFVFHCFTGTDAELDQLLEFGAMVSFTGIVTFKNSDGLAKSAARVPIERLMIETDSPYLTPAPHRKVKVNEPHYLRYTASFLAALRGLSLEAFVGATDGNAERFFGMA